MNPKDKFKVKKATPYVEKGTVVEAESRNDDAGQVFRGITGMVMCKLPGGKGSLFFHEDDLEPVGS